MTRPWLAPPLTAALGAACAVAVLAAGQPQPPRHGVAVCEYAATSGPHGPEAMTCWMTNTEGDR